jgi:Restriction Endonuclease associating with ARP
MEARPTGHLNSSQVACVNHLEPACVDAAVARLVLANVEARLTPVALDDGFVEYEWIGERSYLGERGPRTRGSNITSLDALMCSESADKRTLLAIEWKYLLSSGVERRQVTAPTTLDSPVRVRPSISRLSLQLTCTSLFCTARIKTSGGQSGRRNDRARGQKPRGPVRAQP